MIEYQINAEYMFKMSYLTEIGAIDKNNATHGHCMWPQFRTFGEIGYFKGGWSVIIENRHFKRIQDNHGSRSGSVECSSNNGLKILRIDASLRSRQTHISTEFIDSFVRESSTAKSR